jgi:hypothetical protein
MSCQDRLQQLKRVTSGRWAASVLTRKHVMTIGDTRNWSKEELVRMPFEVDLAAGDGWPASTPSCTTPSSP